MKWLAVFSLIGLLIMTFLYFNQEPEVIIEQLPPDTLKITTIDTLVLPDTVIQTKVITRIDTINTPADTVYRYVERDITISEKSLKRDYWSLQIWAHSKAPVDSFRITSQIYWDKYFQEVYLPKIRFKCGSKNYKFWLGFLSGSAIVAGSVYLTTQLK